MHGLTSGVERLADTADELDSGSSCNYERIGVIDAKLQIGTIGLARDQGVENYVL